MSGFEVPAAAPQAAHPQSRTSPIWVDETVLAAANQAFEMAQAHGSREVRLEHLLHALTRIEGGAATLELRGVRVVPLRRDSAMLIASEVPVGLPSGGGPPRRSHELEETLRLAAAHASHAGRPASVC
jgi:ATP-dependent Clp protease ATP-binding subunit ClpA